jgi:hypothetical protein
MKTLILAAAIGIGTMLAPAVAHAAPINCPPSQTAVKDADGSGWTCVNKAGNGDQSEDPKNKHR